MVHRPEFKRMVLGLPQSAADFPSVEAVANLAELLRLNLVATFLEDENLLHVAGLPGAREWRSQGGWRPIETAQFVGEMAHAAGTARQLFERIVQHRAIETSFRQARGSAAAICSATTTEDILVVIEPRDPLERVSRPFSALIDAAFKATAAVMIVPSRILRATGPIVAVPSGPDDPAIATACAIAAAVRERVTVLRPPAHSSADWTAIAHTANVPVEFRPVASGRWSAPTLAADLSLGRERLIVVTRGTLTDADIPQVSSLRGIPVLVVEPGAAESTVAPEAAGTTPGAVR
jgi:hypothetical protein